MKSFALAPLRSRPRRIARKLAAREGYQHHRGLWLARESVRQLSTALDPSVPVSAFDDGAPGGVLDVRGLPPRRRKHRAPTVIVDPSPPCEACGNIVEAEGHDEACEAAS